MKQWSLLLAGLIVVGIAGMAGYRLQLQQTNAPQPLPTATDAAAQDSANAVVGQLRPAFELPDTDGKLRHIKEWDGQILAVNFWATWCEPCKVEVPEFIELQDAYRDAGVTFIGVAIDSKDNVTVFAEDFGINYPLLVGQQAAIDAARDYGNKAGALPYTVFVEPGGEVVYAHHGRIHQAEVEEILTVMLAAAAVPPLD